MDVLKSKKFWLAIIGAIIPVINKEFDINLDVETILGILGLIATAIVGIAHVDGKKALANGGASVDTGKPTNTGESDK